MVSSLIGGLAGFEPPWAQEPCRHAPHRIAMPTYILPALQCPTPNPHLVTLAFCPCSLWPELFCSFAFSSLALITDSHLLFLLLSASCLSLAPAGLARPSQGARGAGRDCRLGSAPVGEMSQPARVTVSPRRQGWSQGQYFWKAWPGSPSHAIYLLSEVIVNNESHGHGDHPWRPPPILGSYLWESIWRKPLATQRTSVSIQLIHVSQTSRFAPLHWAWRWVPGTQIQ